MKYIKTYEQNKKHKVFHCYMPYHDEETFEFALTQIDITKEIREDIMNYLTTDDNFFYDEDYVGCFLRFFDDQWDFYEIDEDEYLQLDDLSITKKLCV